MTAEVVLYEVVDQVAWVTINRPEKHNAMNAAVRQSLFDAFRRAEADDDCRVLVVTGAGERAFSAGGDLSEMSETALGVPTADFAPRLRKNISFTKPSIAAVNGFAYAGGFLLAQSCDLCVAVEDAQFAITEAKWSRGAPWSVPALRMLPQRVLLEMLLTAQPVSAKRMHELGFVNRLATRATLHDVAAELAATIVANAPLTVAGHVKMTYLAGEMGVTAAETAADAVFQSIYTSQDAQEGPLAFREKRAPVWKGR